jgi:hypothetical protein
MIEKKRAQVGSQEDLRDRLTCYPGSLSSKKLGEAPHEKSVHRKEPSSVQEKRLSLFKGGFQNTISARAAADESTPLLKGHAPFSQLLTNHSATLSFIGITSNETVAGELVVRANHRLRLLNPATNRLIHC